VGRRSSALSDGTQLTADAVTHRSSKPPVSPGELLLARRIYLPTRAAPCLNANERHAGPSALPNGGNVIPTLTAG
jgi:hypothetical protein